MNDFDKIMKKQQEMIDKLNGSGVFSALKVLEESSASRALNPDKDSIAILHEDNAIRSLREEAERTQSLLEPLNKYTSSYWNLNSVLESYKGISELTCVSRQVAQLIEPLYVNTKFLQNITPIMDSVSKISSLTNRVYEEPSLLTYLHEALESQIDTSLWDYYDSIDMDEEKLATEAIDEIIEIVQSPDINERIRIFLREKSEKGKKILVQVVMWITFTFLSGLFTSYCEPIYIVLTPSFLHKKTSVETKEVTEIPKNTEIHVWNDVTNDFVEITCQINGTEHQGYITREELENNTELISSEVTYEHISFTNDIVEILARKWDTDPDNVYEFLNVDTNLINTYILKYYDVLKYLDESELARNLEEHCKLNGIEISPGRNNVEEKIE